MGKRARRSRISRRMTLIASVAIVGVIAATGTVLADPAGWFRSGDNPWPYSPTGRDPVLATVGDISCQPGSPQESEKATDVCTSGATATARNAAQNATAEQVEAMNPRSSRSSATSSTRTATTRISRTRTTSTGARSSSSSARRRATTSSTTTTARPASAAWGTSTTTTASSTTPTALRSTRRSPTRPPVMSSPSRPRSPTDRPATFGQTGNGWYSYNLGNWHLISLNVECADEPGGCSPTGSWFASETKWLAQDLNQDHSPVHARLLAPADVQFDRHPVHLRQRGGPGRRRMVEAALRPPRDADPQRARPRVLALCADGSGR